MKTNETKTTYLAPKVKVVKVAVERGFAGTGPQSAFFLWLAATGAGEGTGQSLESRTENTTTEWGNGTTWF